VSVGDSIFAQQGAGMRKRLSLERAVRCRRGTASHARAATLRMRTPAAPLNRPYRYAALRFCPPKTTAAASRQTQRLLDNRCRVENDATHTNKESRTTLLDNEIRPSRRKAASLFDNQITHRRNSIGSLALRGRSFSARSRRRRSSCVFACLQSPTAPCKEASQSLRSMFHETESWVP
jgi:hypothetical protein